MWVAIDIGATKTLIAVFDESGKIVKSSNHPTAKNYQQFLGELSTTFQTIAGGYKFKSAGVGVPGLIDRNKGSVIALGNLDWGNQPIQKDISGAIGGIPTVIENDSRLAGLSEAQFLLDKFAKVLYFTISTGIGAALIENGQIVSALQDTEAGKMPLQHQNRVVAWEDFASGRAIIKKYGKKASEINDPAAWDEIAKNIAYGVAATTSVMQPEAIIFGGGVGQFSAKFIPQIEKYLTDNLHPVIRQPKLLPAKRPEDAVIYGCYIRTRQKYDG